MKRFASLVLALAIVPSVFAARSPSSSGASSMSPQDSARTFYDGGQRRLDKAAKLHAEMKEATDPAIAAKLKGKLDKTLEGAVADFNRAVKNDPNLFQAYSELGFTLRKLGRYDQSLAAYDRALEIQPGFAAAIEYRAEAHLGLNRLDEARQAYATLYAGDRPRADILFEAMRTWVAARRADPAGVDAQQIDQFAAWVDQRSALHPNAVAANASVRSW